MNPMFAEEVAKFEAMESGALAECVARYEHVISLEQRLLAAARKAQKNQKRAAKKDRKE